VTTTKRAAAELIGTFWLVFGGCGTAVLAGGHVGWLGVSFAFGLTVVAMAYAIGHISGCHLNPAVTIGLVAGGREKPSIIPSYVIAQVLGAILASVLLMVLVQGSKDMSWEAIKTAKTAGTFATNGYGQLSPGGFDLKSVFVGETVLTFIFLYVILGATDERAPKGFAGLIIGLTLTLIHLIGIGLDNLSVNPARSTGPALLVGGEPLAQVWVFWVAPILGAALAGPAYRALGTHAHGHLELDESGETKVKA